MVGLLGSARDQFLSPFYGIELHCLPVTLFEMLKHNWYIENQGVPRSHNVLHPCFRLITQAAEVLYAIVSEAQASFDSSIEVQISVARA